MSRHKSYDHIEPSSFTTSLSQTHDISHPMMSFPTFKHPARNMFRINNSKYFYLLHNKVQTGFQPRLDSLLADRNLILLLILANRACKNKFRRRKAIAQQSRLNVTWRRVRHLLPLSIAKRFLLTSGTASNAMWFKRNQTQKAFHHDA